ncbi:fimbrial protein FimV [Acinetobacter wanghuae]|uniref:Fimbrial protein FimV n=1 Tax=Acinetobacter wanghuae TaxID=2662362 RepID=A0A5Q0P0D0_9GAMM|nr:fimbrial protein FimV [Acinetobacter wanghuae]MQW90956.1 fimbrial protein FimV [Acinetobacter wanghuae]QGA10216.1 fimbrial protein FimV [Acinetobacter wanghuae]
MLIYLIPLVILIIVLLVLKKRQDAQGAAKAKPTSRTKTTASSSKAPQKTKVVEEPVAVKQTATPLSADLRQKIEGLITAGNYFAAEAQINQALNRDNSQHELYLLLLDIHTKQKDDFAISQLINHIRSLQLDEVLEKAKAQKAEYEKFLPSSNDTIGFHSVDNTTTADAFAELEAPHVADDTAFDALQDEAKPSTKSVFEAKPTQNDIQPLEFNFEPLLTQTEIPVEKPATEALHFDSNFDFTPSSPIVESVESATPVVAPTLAFDLESTAPAEPVAVDKPEEIQPLDFSFSLDSATTTPEKTEESIAIDLDLTNIKPITNEVAPTAALESSTFDFKLDSIEEKTETAPSALSIDVPETTVIAVDRNDPLVQSFPELVENDEISLNLSLAEQYIKLGAYNAARELLAEKESEYSALQHEQAKQLLNQIAS